MIIVFHVKYPTFMPVANLKDSELEPVAIFHGNNLDEAYERTNHVYGDWTETGADDMTVIGNGHRSTSVGDVMVNDEGRWIVDRIGMKRALPAKETA